METTQGNILITEFMGAKEPLEYHADWNSLMLVVGRVRSNDLVDNFTIDFFDKVHISGKTVKWEFKFEQRCNLCGIETVKYSIYKVIVEFIKWRNENK